MRFQRQHIDIEFQDDDAATEDVREWTTVSGDARRNFSRAIARHSSSACDDGVATMTVLVRVRLERFAGQSDSTDLPERFIAWRRERSTLRSPRAAAAA